VSQNDRVQMTLVVATNDKGFIRYILFAGNFQFQITIENHVTMNAK
jgi:hypothetical protein